MSTGKRSRKSAGGRKDDGVNVLLSVPLTLRQSNLIFATVLTMKTLFLWTYLL